MAIMIVATVKPRAQWVLCSEQCAGERGGGVSLSDLANVTESPSWHLL